MAGTRASPSVRGSPSCPEPGPSLSERFQQGSRTCIVAKCGWEVFDDSAARVTHTHSPWKRPRLRRQLRLTPSESPVPPRTPRSRRTVQETAKKDTTGGGGGRLLSPVSGPSLARPRSSVTASRVPEPSSPCNAGRVSSTRGPGTGRASPRLTSSGPTRGPRPGPDEVPSNAQHKAGGRRTGRARTHDPEPRARSRSSARLTSSCGGPGPCSSVPASGLSRAATSSAGPAGLSPAGRRASTKPSPAAGHGPPGGSSTANGDVSVGKGSRTCKTASVMLTGDQGRR